MSLPVRIIRTLVAGLLGAAGSLLVLALVLFIGIIVLQSALLTYDTGRFELVPPDIVSSSPADVEVLNATPAEVMKVRKAISALRYRLPPKALTFKIAIVYYAVFGALSAMHDTWRKTAPPGRR
jgi:hypothetical protein